MCAALVAMAVSDGIYLNLSWSGTYADGSLLEAGWVVAALCLAWSLWLTYAESSERRMTTDRAPIVWPVLWGGGSLALVAVLGIADGTHPISIALAVAGVLSVFGRLMLTDAQNRRLVRAASLQALTDPVTGLGNHRALTGDLRTRARDDAAGAPGAARAVRPQRLQGLQRPLRPSRGRRPARASRHAPARRASRRPPARTGWAATSSASSRSSTPAWSRRCCSRARTTR